MDGFHCVALISKEYILLLKERWYHRQNGTKETTKTEPFARIGDVPLPLSPFLLVLTLVPLHRPLRWTLAARRYLAQRTLLPAS